MEAAYYRKHPDSSVTCTLCPHNCKINMGNAGSCGVRVNSEGLLQSLTYGKVSALNIDPIEKKPLYHFYPGSSILSIGSFGCNLKCNFCQNHSISQVSINSIQNRVAEYSPEMITKRALDIEGNIGIAFTYNEPIVWIEYMMDIASKVKEEGLNTVMISNGYINTLPLEEMITTMDAFNIDLKSFDNAFYKGETGGSLKPVLNTIEKISASGKHLELTMLIIPALNDDSVKFRKMISWISDSCGSDTVLHLSKYFPNYKSYQPITPDRRLIDLFHISREKIRYTYLGNSSVQTGRDTICPECSQTVIERKGYVIDRSGLDDDGNCSNCGALITSYS